MTDNEKIKRELILQLQGKLEQRIRNAQNAINASKESKANETKSSAGDKFETGRAMMQMEQEKAEGQLAISNQLKNTLNLINAASKNDHVQLGSLVRTNQNNYFVSIGLGKLEYMNEIYYAVSLSSPIGQLLISHSKNWVGSFNGNKIEILETY